MSETEMRRDHWDKYEALAQEIGVAVREDQNIFGFFGSAWKTLYAEDRRLNNVPLSRWDFWGHNLAALQRGVARLSMAERVCLLKHVVQRDIIGVSRP